MKQLRISKLAELDLDKIWHHVAKKSDSIETANRVVDSITKHFSTLARQPTAGRGREELAPGLRSFPAEDYVVYYRESGPRVIISRVIHGKRDQEKAFTDDDDKG